MTSNSTFLILAALLMGSLSVQAKPITVIWKEDPITVELPIKTEQRINFPEVIAHLDVPEELESISEFLLTATGVLHLTVKKEIKPIRIFATSVTGSVYILDISASQSSSTKTLTIIDPVLPIQQPAKKTQNKIPDFLKQQGKNKSEPIDYVTLSQFALAHHIGPQRLIPQLDNANSIKLEKAKVKDFVRFNHHIEVKPLLQWQVNNLYVSTLHVKNNGEIPYQFDARGLRGEFLFVATGKLNLQTKNETIWALVSNKPLSRAIHREWHIRGKQ